MNRREFILGSAACAMMPCAKSNDSHVAALTNSDVAKIKDIVKCKKDIVHFAEKHITLHTAHGGHANVKLKDWQKKYLMHLASGEDAVLDAYRQAGKTSTSLVYALWKTMFTPCQKITFVTCSKCMSESAFAAVEAMHSNLPDWMKLRDYASEHCMHGAKHIKMKNGSELVVTHANADFRGYHPGSILVLDELAFFSPEQQHNIVNLVTVAFSCKDPQLVVASSPNASDGLFSRYAECLERSHALSFFKVTCCQARETFKGKLYS